MSGFKTRLRARDEKGNKFLQILQLQCVHFVDFKCFLKTLKEAECFLSVDNFSHVLSSMNLTVSVP